MPCCNQHKRLLASIFHQPHLPMFSFFTAYFSGPVEYQLIPNFPMAARSIMLLPSDPDIAEKKFIGFFVNLTPN